MNPAPEFRYTLDEAYLETAHARRISALPTGKRLFARFFAPVQMVGMWILFLWVAHGDLYLQILVLVGVPGLFVFGFLKERKDRRERFYRTPLEDAPVSVVFTEDALEVDVVGSRIRVNWSLQVRARTFEDGWILFEASGEARWLPKAGLTRATPEQVDEWLCTRIREFARMP